MSRKARPLAATLASIQSKIIKTPLRNITQRQKKQIELKFFF